MAATQWPFVAAVLLLLSSDLHCSSSLPTCPQSCDCQRATLLNCSLSGLSSVPQLIQDSVTELDLSHNLLNSVTLHRPYRNLRNVRLGNNTIAHLSLCIDRNLDGKYLRGRRGLRPWRRGGCVPWAPTLQLLSAERNLLEQLPQGLEGVGSLQVLQLSFNRISTLRPEDLSHLHQLKKLDLKHNLITSLHPQMFQDLVQLKVLDMSFNMLTNLNPLTYFTLRSIGVDVGLGGNRWKCDCSMRSLRRRMAYDSSRGLKTWKMVCASPSALSGRDLLQLEEDDLNCFSTEISQELHQDVTVYSGSEILLSCSAEDSVWWTPNGQASVSHPQAGLLISDITEKDTGLYVCVSEENQVVSVFNLQISQMGGAKRKPRSLPNISRQIIPQGSLNRIGELRNQTTTQSDLVLGVCLSILVTFLVAFILGVIARPCIDVLWQKVTIKKRSTERHVVSSGEQRQYDNEAYSVSEEQEAIEPFRERRVTVSDVNRREENNVQYYDTVASGNQESIDNDEVFDGEAAEAKRLKRTVGDSGSDSSSLQSNQGDEQNDGRDLSGKASAGQTHSMEFERIPDSSELEKRRRMSSSSDSSQSENEVDHTTLKSPQVALDSLQQKSDLPTTGKVEVPQMSIEARSEIHGFSSEPFSDWSPNTDSTDHVVLQENEELFEFSDSTRSSSALDSFNDPKLTVAPTLDKKKGDDMSTSSSSSHVSEDEQYTVNSDNKGVYKHDTKRPAPRPSHSFSSDSSDDEPVQSTIKQAGKEKLIHENDKLSSRTVTGEKDVSEKIKPMPRTKWRGVGLAVASVSKGVAPSPPARHSSTSGSDNEAEIPDLKGKQNKGTVSQNKVTLNNSAPLPSSGSSSSSDSEEETTKHIRKQEQGDVYMSKPPIKVSRTVSHEKETQRPAVDFEHTTSIKRHPDIKAPSISSDSSSSSDNEDEKTDQTKKQGDVDVTQLPLKGSQTISRESETKRPALDLEHTTSNKRQVDIQAPSEPFASSSSSDSEDETKGQIEKQRPRKFNTPQLPFQGSQTKSPDARWPTLDLQRIPRLKRHLDIKAPSAPSDSSSSSDSEEETTKSIKNHGELHMSRPSVKVSPTVSHDPGTQRPLLNLEHTTPIKRHPDIKAPPAVSDSSSSSDSEDETTKHMKKQEQQPPVKVSQTLSLKPETERPAIDHEHTTSIKKQLDVKAPSASSHSSSSSNSEDEATGHIEKQMSGKLITTGLPLQGSQTKHHNPDAKWPGLDLRHIPRLKRRLDIKAPSPASDSSSSSDSEEETTKSIKNHGELHMSRPSVKVSPTVSHDPGTQRPLLNLEHTTPIKRHPDIKAPPPASDSSSSSDSEDETKTHIKKQEHGNILLLGPPNKVSPTVSHEPETQWPLLDLERSTSTKRRLDIKPQSAASDSSSSSDSEDETTKHMKKQEQQPPVRVSQTLSLKPETQRPAIDLEHTTSIKKQLDIKAPSASSDSSSSSDSDDEKGHVEKQRPGKLITTGLSIQGSQTKHHDPDAKWLGLDLRHIPRLKRRLDIKAPSAASNSSSSSDSEEETTKSIKNHGELHMSRPSIKVSQTVGHESGTQTPLIDLEHTTPINRRLDVKAPTVPSDSSSSSDSEDETTTHAMKKGDVHVTQHPNKISPTVRHEPETRWPFLDLEHTTSIRRRLDIKTVPSGSSSSNDSENETTSHTEKQRPGKLDIAGLPLRQSPSVDIGNITHKKQLDIKAQPTQLDQGLKSVSLGSRKSESNSSTSDSEDEKRNHKAQVGAGVSVTSKVPEKDLMNFPKAPLRTIFHSPKTEQNIKLIKYTVVSDDVGNKPTNDNIHKTPEISPELQSHWATMNLSLSRSRKRLESTSQKQKLSDLPSSPPPDSPSYSSESGPGSPISRTRLKRKDVRITLTGSSLIHDNKPVKASPTMKDPSDTMFGFGVPHNRKHLDIRGSEKAPATASQQQPDSSSSSDSEDESVDYKAPDMSIGIPRFQRHLNMKPPSPEPSSSSSSSSESEKEVQKYSDKQSRYALNMTDSDSAITYKRAIIKTSSLLGNSLSPRGKSQSVDHANAPASPRIAPSMSVDDVVKTRIQQSQRKTDLDLPPQLTWTGVGHHLSDLSISTPNLNTVSTQPVSPAEPKRPPAYTSSTKSDIKRKQDSGKSDVTIVHKHSSLRADPVSPAFRGALHKLMNLPSNTYETPRAVTEDTRERKGLKALQSMALERQKWEAEDLNKGAFALFDGSVQPSDTSFDYRRSEADIQVLSKQPLTYLPSASITERRPTDLSYEVSHYRSHNVREPSQVTPPAIPATPPPSYQAAGLTPQNTQKQVWEGNKSYQQQRRSSDTSDTSSENSNSPNFDYSNRISQV